MVRVLFYTPRASSVLSCLVVFLGGKPNRFGEPQFGEIQMQEGTKAGQSGVNMCQPSPNLNGYQFANGLDTPAASVRLGFRGPEEPKVSFGLQNESEGRRGGRS